MNIKGIAIGAAVGAGAGYIVKQDPMKCAIVGAIVTIAGPMIDGLLSSAMTPAPVNPPAPK